MRKLNPGMVVLSAGTVVLGGSLLVACGLVALLLISFTSTSRPSPTRTPTQTLATATAADARATITAAVALPPTLLPTLTLTTRPSGDPADTVREYYRLVSAEQLDATWMMLSDDFKEIFNCCAPDYNYEGYIQWWTSVDRVELNGLRTVSQSGNRAVVYVELGYRMKAGSVSEDSEPYIELVYDPTRATWLFDDKGPTETGRVN